MRTARIALACLVIPSFAFAAACASTRPTASANASARARVTDGIPDAVPTVARAEDFREEAVVDTAAAAPREMKKTEAPAPLPAAPVSVAMATPPAEPMIGNFESYKDYGVNAAVDPAKDRLSTFAIDVDTASYAISRVKLTQGSLPPFASVRAEEYLNYFRYDYAPPTDAPFAVHVAGAPSPYAAGHHLVRVALQGKRIAAEARSPVHLVYLVDVSGSMMSDDKIGLAKKSLRLLTSALRPGDTVALCTYAGAVREVLPPTGVDKRDQILAAIDDLSASGSTAMASGIKLAYDLASRTLVRGHVNRVVILSDGDANVGNTSESDLSAMIKTYRDQGITLSTVGFGQGNYKDATMEQLADKGDGNYAYIDSQAQAKRVFVEQLDGLLQVIARDVKIQVEWNPKAVTSYRLIGYENRDVADKDFRNDKVDAGEIGAGHAVTAMYDVVLSHPDLSPLTVRVRNKAPLAPTAGADAAVERAYTIAPTAISKSFDAAPESFRFATAVTGFAEILRKSPYARGVSFAQVSEIAKGAIGDGRERAERLELVGLVKRAAELSGGEKTGGAIVAR